MPRKFPGKLQLINFLNRFYLDFIMVDLFYLETQWKLIASDLRQCMANNYRSIIPRSLLGESMESVYLIKWKHDMTWENVETFYIVKNNFLSFVIMIFKILFFTRVLYTLLRSLLIHNLSAQNILTKILIKNLENPQNHHRENSKETKNK